MSFVQLLCALVTAHFNRLAADGDLDRVLIELAVAGRARRLSHDIYLLKPTFRVPPVGHSGRESRYQDF
jgi:hypothetical protein